MYFQPYLLPPHSALIASTPGCQSLDTTTNQQPYPQVVMVPLLVNIWFISIYFQPYLPPPHSILDTNASPFIWSPPLLPAGLTNQQPYPQVVNSYFVNKDLVHIHVFPALPTSTSFHP